MKGIGCTGLLFTGGVKKSGACGIGNAGVWSAGGRNGRGGGSGCSSNVGGVVRNGISGCTGLLITGGCGNVNGKPGVAGGVS